MCRSDHGVVWWGNGNLRGSDTASRRKVICVRVIMVRYGGVIAISAVAIPHLGGRLYRRYLHPVKLN